MRLEGKVAIVTGAASGIGRASAEKFRGEGAIVIAADINKADGVIKADASNEDDVKMLINIAVEEHGGLDIFFANAGITGSLTPLLEESVELWERVLKINLISPFLAIKHAAPAMKKRGGGSIICTASVAGLRAGAGPSSYSASKAGVINLVQLASTQLAGSNIRVNGIAPGLVQTAMTQDVFDSAKESDTEHLLGSLCSLKRAGQPEELANVALFLASEEASYVHGEIITVDGGASASHNVAKQRVYGEISF